MAQTLSLTAACTSNAAFRAWGSAISAALAINGQVQTADTGQVNWTTVVASGSANTAVGYEVWRFNDALQSTAPVFFKLEYGNAGSVNNPQLWITVGTGTDGAGTITGTNITGVFGALTTRRTVAPINSASSANAAGNVYVNGDAGCLALFAWPALNTTFGGALLLIERHRLWDGTTAGDGFVLLTSCNGSNAGDAQVAYSPVCYLPNVAANVANSATGFAGPVSLAGMTFAEMSSVIGGVLYPLPVPISGGVRTGAPSQYVMAINAGDYPANATFTMSHYGVSRTWLSAGVGCGSNVNCFGASWGPGNTKSLIFRTT